MSPRAFEDVYGPKQRQAIGALVDMATEPLNAAEALENPELLRDAEVVFSGWGGPRIDEFFLELAPRLKAVFYAAGSVKPIISDAFWNRGIRISSAYGSNAVAVAEYVLAMVVLGLKQAFSLNRQVTAERSYVPLYLDTRQSVPGTYGTTVGIVSLGMTGKQVVKMLANLSVEVIAYDPHVSEDAARALGVKRMCALDEIFALSDAVTLHTPLLPDTEAMIRGHHIRAMKPESVFINASRGAVVQEQELIDALKSRPDIQAILDVSEPEPPVAGSPLYDLPNVFLTPHIAGSAGSECHRMSQEMYEECKRFLSGQPLKWEITKEMLSRIA